MGAPELQRYSADLAFDLDGSPEIGKTDRDKKEPETEVQYLQRWRAEQVLPGWWNRLPDAKERGHSWRLDVPIAVCQFAASSTVPAHPFRGVGMIRFGFWIAFLVLSWPHATATTGVSWHLPTTTEAYHEAAESDSSASIVADREMLGQFACVVSAAPACTVRWVMQICACISEFRMIRSRPLDCCCSVSWPSMNE